MKRNNRAGKRALLIILVILIIAGLGGAGVWYYFHLNESIQKVYDEKLAAAKNEYDITILQNTRIMYVAAVDLKAGDELTAENIKQVQDLSAMPAELFADASDIGKRVLVDTPANSQILKAVLTSKNVENSVREMNYTDIITVSGNILPGDYIDIRLRYPDGTDYIVASKKRISASLDGLNTIDMNEEEILLMDSAIVDAYLYGGGIQTTIYATKYVEPLLQDAAVSTYIPSQAIIDEIKTDPNIVSVASNYLIAEARKAKEGLIAAYEKITDPSSDDEIREGAIRDYEEQNNYLEQYLNTTDIETSLSSYDNIGAREDDTKIEE